MIETQATLTLPFDRLAVAFHQAPDFTRRELFAWMTYTGLHMEGEVKKRTPKKEGTLQNSINAVTKPVGRFGVESIVGTSLNYAVPVEDDVKPHDIVAKNGKALQFMMRGVPIMVKRVRHPGSKGAFMFKKSFEANISQIMQDFERFVDHVTLKIAQGVR